MASDLGVCGVLAATPICAGRRLRSHSDLRRLLTTHGPAILDKMVCEVMTKNPKKISGDALASEVMAIMKQFRVDEIPVVDNDNRPVGLIDVQDLVVLKMFDVEAAT